MSENIHKIDVAYLKEDFGKWFDDTEWNRLVISTQENTDQRLYEYRKKIRETCTAYFRGKDGDAYCFNGMYWEKINVNMILIVLQDILIERRYATYKNVNALQKMLKNDVVQGISISELRPRNNLVGFLNGVWDFEDIDAPVYHPFSERCEITYVLDYEYIEGAVAPTWERFLAEMLSQSQIEVLQRYLGLGVVDRKKMGHKIEETLWLVGTGGNGKSVINEIVHACYGDRNISDSGLLSLIRGYGDDRMRNLAAIEGKIFNYCSEVQADDISPYMDAFKSLCSGEPQMVRRIGRNVEQAYDIPFLIFNMNHKPKISKSDHAISRRLRIITFDMQVDPRDMKKNLADDIKKELPGVRNWMIEGYKKLRSHHYNIVSSKDEEQERIDTLAENGAFVQIWMIKGGYRPNRYAGRWEEKSENVSATQLFNEFTRFCVKNGYDVSDMTPQSFGRQLNHLGFKRKRIASCVVYEVFMDEDAKEKRNKIYKQQ